MDFVHCSLIEKLCKSHPMLLPAMQAPTESWGATSVRHPMGRGDGKVAEKRKGLTL